MQSGTLIRAMARVSSRIHVAHLRQSPWYLTPSFQRRAFSSHPEPKRPVEPATVKKPTEVTATIDATKADVATPTAMGAEKGIGKMPDVSSTSLGLEYPEDPHTKDPLKWRKFAWKYAGAVLVFFISYKSLHWYVDNLEKDGKRRRQEVEENKELVAEMSQPQQTANASRTTPAFAMGGLGGAQVQPKVDEGVVLEKAKTAQVETMPPLKIFDSVKEEEPNTVSELDELFVYKIELQAKLRDLGEEKGSKETETEKRELEAELKALASEIRELELKQRSKS